MNFYFLLFPRFNKIFIAPINNSKIVYLYPALPLAPSFKNHFFDLCEQFCLQRQCLRVMNDNGYDVSFRKNE
ncbi:hypothetical protein L596_020292 [Steinernema carpocapsae]|uniref:Uncharacterized protein n=1 Tax=Steinernema carpocapsae TaxID=34508 RepID=A0A4U5MTA8_STECR|nr:hypothetical protein L596_020292 [Steinernema carpocapsae]